MTGIGIDFGTSNSAVAAFDGRELTLIRVDGDASVMPTALYLSRELKARVGRAAIEAYMRENAGRQIGLSRENVGSIEVTVSGGDLIQGSLEDGGAITDVFTVHAYTDRDLPGRLFRSVKRWLGDATLERVRVFDARYRIVALVTPVLKHLFEAASAPDAAVYVGRPVRFEGRDERASRVAAERLTEACGYAGIAEPTLYPEPVAAALSYLHRTPGSEPECVLAFDFGGGTLDLTVLRARAEEFQILATYGAGIGGDEIDRLIYRARIFPELGEGAPVWIPVDADLKRFPFEFELFAERLLNWPLAYELNRPELREKIAQAMHAVNENADRFSRLHRLVSQNHGYRVFQAIERAKIELSTDESALISVPEIGLKTELRRSELEVLLSPMLADITDCLDRVLAASDIRADEVTRVIRTGGSSCIPVVRRLLDERFPGRVVEHDPFTSVAAGLAIASHRGAPPV